MFQSGLNGRVPILSEKRFLTRSIHMMQKTSKSAVSTWLTAAICALFMVAFGVTSIP